MTFRTEEIADSDVIIAVTDDDKLNLLVVLVKSIRLPKTVVRVGRPEYIMLMEQWGLMCILATLIYSESNLRFVVVRRCFIYFDL
ncbi:MAG: NAD-binding protein [Veillonella sp.]